MFGESDNQLQYFTYMHALQQQIEPCTIHRMIFPMHCTIVVTDCMGAPLFIKYLYMTYSHDAYTGIRWDKATETWVDKRPDACAPTGSQVPPKDFKDGTPRSEITCDNSHCMYTNLYYNGGRWYALVDGSTAVPHFRFSRNQEIATIHVEDSWDFIDSVK